MWRGRSSSKHSDTANIHKALLLKLFRTLHKFVPRSCPHQLLTLRLQKMQKFKLKTSNRFKWVILSLKNLKMAAGKILNDRGLPKRPKYSHIRKKACVRFAFHPISPDLSTTEFHTDFSWKRGLLLKNHKVDSLSQSRKNWPNQAVLWIDWQFWTFWPT